MGLKAFSLYFSIRGPNLNFSEAVKNLSANPENLETSFNFLLFCLAQNNLC